MDINQYLNREIARLEVRDSKLVVWFTAGGGVTIMDDGQNFCEERFITCDDDLTTFVGAKILSFEESEVEVHDHPIRDGGV